MQNGRRFAGITVAGLLLGIVALPDTAEAAERRRSLHEGRGYVYGSPLVMYVPLGDSDVNDLVEVGYQWGLGAGGRIPIRAEHFMMTVGVAFEHSPLSLDEDVDDVCGLLGSCDVRAHVWRVTPEARIGGRTDYVFLYGNLTPGVSIVTSQAEATALGVDFDERDVDVGANLGLGVGGQFVVWRGVFVGIEIGTDLGFFTESDDDEIDNNADFDDDSYGFYTLDIKVLAGWWF